MTTTVTPLGGTAISTEMAPVAARGARRNEPHPITTVVATLVVALGALRAAVQAGAAQVRLRSPESRNRRTSRLWTRGLVAGLIGLTIWAAIVAASLLGMTRGLPPG